MAQAVESGRATVTYAAVRGMGGNDQLRLLAWLCGTDPALVEDGRAALAVAVAEARRIRRNRQSTLRSRRKRREARQPAA